MVLTSRLSQLNRLVSVRSVFTTDYGHVCLCVSLKSLAAFGPAATSTLSHNVSPRPFFFSTKFNVGLSVQHSIRLFHFFTVCLCSGSLTEVKDLFFKPPVEKVVQSNDKENIMANVRKWASEYVFPRL